MTTRDRLQHLFGNTWEKTVFQQKWTEFAARTDHTVRMIEPPLSDKQKWLIPNMNCFSYALRLHNLPHYSRWIKRCDALSVLNGQFINALIEQKFLTEIDDADSPVDSLVVYYECGYITHMGTILTADKYVRSKFNISEFYEHGLLEVQTSFGNPTKFLEQPTNEMRKTIIAELGCI